MTENKFTTDSEDNLENYYAGEDCWENLAKNYENIETMNTKELLNLLNNDIKLVNVIEGIVGNSSIMWIKRNIPALNNMKPIDCINNDFLLIRLKECLLRMG